MYLCDDVDVRSDMGKVENPGVNNSCEHGSFYELNCSSSELEKFVLSHRTVPNEAGDHRAASELPLGRGRFVDPPLREAPTSITAYTVRGSSV